MKAKEIQKLAVKFEKKNGTAALLKVGCSAINRLLVDKGFITKRECYNYFENELKRYNNKK